MQPAATPETFVFQAASQVPLTDHIWRFARSTASAKTGSVKIIALLGPARPDPLKPLIDDLLFVHEAQSGSASTRKRSPLCHDAFSALDRNGRRVGTLLDIDCAPRAELEMAGLPQPHPLFQTELRDASKPWRARLSLLARPLPLATLAAIITLATLGLAAAGHIKGYPGSFENITGAAWFYLKTKIAGIDDPAGVWPAVIAVSILLSLLVYLINIFLPSALRIKYLSWMNKYVEKAQPVQDFLARNRWFSHLNERPVALRWVTRHLFGKTASQGFAILALRNPDLWPPDDLDRLRALVQKRPAAQNLVIIVPVHTGSQIGSGLLTPWFDPATRRPNPALPAAIEILVLPETTSPPPKPNPAIDALILLGTGKPEKPKAPEKSEASRTAEAEARKRVGRDLCDDRLTINDIIPLLTFGSVPESPFILTFDEQNTSPSLEQVVSPYVRFVSDNPADSSLPFQPADAEMRVRNSPCTILHTQRLGKRSNRRLIGRGTHRDELATALRPIFAALNGDFEAYARVLAGCGQLFNLLEVAKLLDTRSLSPETAMIIVRRLRAAATLARKGPAFPDSSHRLEIILGAWTTVAEHLPAARFDEASPPSLAPPWLAIEMIGLAFGPACPRPDEARRRLLEMIALPPDPVDPQAGPTLAQTAALEIERVLSRLPELDPAYASRLLDRQLAHPWQPIAEFARDTLHQRLNDMRATRQPLAQRLLHAAEYDDFAAILRAHAGDLPRFMALCYCLAARAARDLDAQQHLAETMLKHRAAGLQVAADIAVDPLEGESPLIGHLADPRTDHMIRHTPPPPTPTPTPTPGAQHDTGDTIYFGSLDPLNAEIENIVNIVTSPPKTPQAPLDFSS